MKRESVNVKALRSRVKPEKFSMAKRMLDNPTTAEGILAHKFKHSRLRNWECRRQEVALGYILDFYFPAVGVCVEVDGHHHRLDPVQIEWDKRRDEALLRAGIQTIRVSNESVINHKTRTVVAIRKVIFEKAQRLIRTQRIQKS